MGIPSHIEPIMLSEDGPRTSVLWPEEDASDNARWTLALAAGDDTRLDEYVLRRFGSPIPKQYCRVLGDRSMLEHTLDRLLPSTPSSRTLTVIAKAHVEHAIPQLHDRSDHIVRQPADRDTGMAAFVGLAMIKHWAPNAVVMITPTDHYVSSAARYLQSVRTARGVAAGLRERIVLLGAPATEPDPDLSYLELGGDHLRVPPVRDVSAVVEEPSVQRAEQLSASGALWNTLVAFGTVDAFWALGRQTVPSLMTILDSLVPLVGSREEADAIEYIYRAYPAQNFARDMLARAPERLLALALEDVEWSDWGHASRIETTIARRRGRAGSEPTT